MNRELNDVGGRLVDLIFSGSLEDAASGNFVAAVTCLDDSPISIRLSNCSGLSIMTSSPSDGAGTPWEEDDNREVCDTCAAGIGSENVVRGGQCAARKSCVARSSPVPGLLY